jgi:hypothetical protein
MAGVAAGFGPMSHQPQITIGERHRWGDPRPFGIPAIDARQHLYIIGKTGSGKTTLLRNLILQHIALRHGVARHTRGARMLPNSDCMVTALLAEQKLDFTAFFALSFYAT